MFIDAVGGAANAIRKRSKIGSDTTPPFERMLDEATRAEAVWVERVGNRRICRANNGPMLVHVLVRARYRARRTTQCPQVDKFVARALFFGLKLIRLRYPRERQR